MRRPLAVLILLLAMGAGAHAQPTGTAESRPALGETQAAAPESTATSQPRREDLFALRSAETEAVAGRIDEAVQIYSGVAGSPGVAREVLAAAAVGLYRTGAFREAALAFRRLGTFALGEEDLRYYYAVSLFEAGNYADAERELACALPFIQVTDDVTRYRIKIETMADVAIAMARN